jgi:hypothetical protein
MPRYTDEDIMEALRETKGLIYVAAKRLGCDPETISNRAKKVSAVAQVLKAERGGLVDLAELKLYAAVQDGQPWAIALVLKTLGKDRGYVEKMEHGGQGGVSVNVVNHVSIDQQAPALTAEGRANQVMDFLEQVRTRLDHGNARASIDEVHPSQAPSTAEGLPELGMS